MRRRRKRQTAWRSVAERRGGRYVEAVHKIWSWNSPTIDVAVGDVAVHVDIHLVQVGNVQQAFTRFRACYLLGMGPPFKVYRGSITGKLGTMLGFEDVELGGDACFDKEFIVRSSAPEATRKVFSGTAKRRLLDVLKGHIQVSSEGQAVTLLDSKTVMNEEVLEAGIDLVGELASYGSDWLVALRGLDGAIWVPPQGPWNDRSTPSVRLEPRGVPVHLYPALVGLGLSVTAAAEMQRQLPSFTLGCDAQGRLSDNPPAGAIGPRASQLLAEVAEASIEHDGHHLRITLAGQLRPNRLEATAELAAAIAFGEGSDGVFR